MIRAQAILPRRSGRSLATLAIVLTVVVVDIAVGLACLLGTQERLPQVGLLVMVGLLALVGLTIKRIEYGILLLPVVAVLVPLTVATGTGSPVVAGLLFAGFLMVVWVGRMLVRREIAIVRSPLTVPLVAFAATAVLAVIYAGVERPALVYVWPSFLAAQLGGLGVLLVSAGALFVVMNSIRDMRWIKLLVWVYLALGALTIVAFLARSHQDISWFSIRGLFSLWVISLAFGQAVFNGQLPRWVRLALLAVALAWLYRRFSLDSGWLSGWMPAVVAIATIAFLRSRQHLLVVVIAAVTIGWLNSDALLEVYEVQTVGIESRGNLVRLEVWRQSLEVVRDHLLLGTGMAGYAPYYMTFFPDRAMASHSNYLDVLSQTGLIGSFFFLWFLAAIFRVGINARRKSTSGFAAGFVNGMLGGTVGLVVAMLLGDWFIPFVYTQTIAGFRHTVHSWVLLGALASMPHLRDG